MNRLRNFIYEKNDLIVALLVVLITASILWWKIDGIMEYPKKLVAGRLWSAASETHSKSRLPCPSASRQAIYRRSEFLRCCVL